MEKIDITLDIVEETLNLRDKIHEKLSKKKKIKEKYESKFLKSYVYYSS